MPKLALVCLSFMLAVRAIGNLKKKLNFPAKNIYTIFFAEIGLKALIFAWDFAMRL